MNFVARLKIKKYDNRKQSNDSKSIVHLSCHSYLMFFFQIVSLKIKFAIEKLLIINFISHLLSFIFFHLIFFHTTYSFDAILFATHFFSFVHDFHFFRSFVSISISQMSSFFSCSFSMMYCAIIALIFILYSFFVVHFIIHILT